MERTQESPGPSEGTLQSEDTAQDKMPENQSQGIVLWINRHKHWSSREGNRFRY